MSIQQKPWLFVDDGEDSKQAVEDLKQAGIDVQVFAGDESCPALLTGIATYHGLTYIRYFIEEVRRSRETQQ